MQIEQQMSRECPAKVHRKLKIHRVACLAPSRCAQLFRFKWLQIASIEIWIPCRNAHKPHYPGIQRLSTLYCSGNMCVCLRLRVMNASILLTTWSEIGRAVSTPHHKRKIQSRDRWEPSYPLIVAWLLRIAYLHYLRRFLAQMFSIDSNHTPLSLQKVWASSSLF